jgi:hypothetical protein
MTGPQIDTLSVLKIIQINTVLVKLNTFSVYILTVQSPVINSINIYMYSYGNLV